MRKNSVKNIRINEEVMRELSNIISPEAPVPVVNVESEDFVAGGAGNVAVNLAALGAKPTIISVLGDDEAVKKTLEGLKSSAGFIRRELARRINLRNTPEITFVSDQSIAYAAKMSKLIDEVNAPLHKDED